LVNALLSLHACGLTVLNLEANNIAGSIPDAFAELVNLKVQNLGEQQVAELISTSSSVCQQQQREVNGRERSSNSSSQQSAHKHHNCCQPVQ
jgi:hypothetical protein